MDRRDWLKSTVLAVGGAAFASPARAIAAPAAAQAPALHIDGPDGGGGHARFAGALQRIARYADAHRRQYRLPGLTLVCIAPQGYTAFVRSGYSHSETHRPLAPGELFQIGSISKSFVAMCVHQLAQEGRLALTDDIRKHLPEVALPPEPPISLINLLDHSSGLPDDAPLFPRTPDGKLWSAFAPGSAWSYSNTGFDLLGLMVARLDQAPLAKCLERRIFGPLGMKTARGQIVASERARYAASYTPWDDDKDNYPGGRLGPAAWVNVTGGAGCIAATTADMAHWLRYLAQAGAGKGAPLLSDKAAAAYVSATVAAPAWPSGSTGAHYGAGLAHVEVEGRTLLHHTGGMVSFSSAMHVDPQAGVGCFASTNSGKQEYRPRDVTAYACALLRSVVEPHAGLSPRPAPIKPGTAAPPPSVAGTVSPEHARLAGRYENDDPWADPIVIEAREDGLYLGGKLRLEPHPEGYWTPQQPAITERVRFEGMLNGRPQVLNLSGKDFVRRDL